MALNIIEAARLMWCPGLSQLKGNPQGTLHIWLSAATYAPVTKDKDLLLSGIDSHSFLTALASDINRTASAASETLKNITQINGMSKSLAWPYVKLYYSSIFYAHAVLRIWGRSPSYFRTLELVNLRNSLKAYSVEPPFKIQTGQYLLLADLNESSVIVQTDNGSGGSHEAVWREFSKALSDLQKIVLNGPYLASDKQKITEELRLFLSLISKNGTNISWPSQMRNDIQYRQAEGVWYPYQGKSKSSNLHKDISNIFNGNFDINSVSSFVENDLDRFRYACISIILFARGVVKDMSIIGDAKNFLRHGQRKFEDAIESNL